MAKRPNFKDGELRDLMSELLGDKPRQIQFCKKSTVKKMDLEHGIPEKSELECRPVWGYTLRGKPLIAINKSDAASSGNLSVYLYCREVAREELTSDARILYEGRSHQVELQNVIYDVGYPQFLECKLIPEQGMSQVVKDVKQSVENLPGNLSDEEFNLY
jgi:hypothetical protein